MKQTTLIIFMFNDIVYILIQSDESYEYFEDGGLIFINFCQVKLLYNH